MEILDGLTSQEKDGSNNYQVAARCLEDRALVWKLSLACKTKIMPSSSIALRCLPR